MEAPRSGLLRGWAEIPADFELTRWDAILDVSPFFASGAMPRPEFEDLLWGQLADGEWTDVSQRCHGDCVRDVSTHRESQVSMPGLTSLVQLRKIWPELVAMPVRDEDDAAARQSWADLLDVMGRLEARFGHVRLMIWAIVPRVYTEVGC
jgi:hypothetical protein